MLRKDMEVAQKEVSRAKSELDLKDDERNALKDEMIRVIRGKSSIDRDMIQQLLDENQAAIQAAQDALTAAQNKLEEIEQENKKAENDCSNLFTWASTYQNASFQQRQAILNQFIKEVRVGRDYDIEIILNVPLEEFEEFKSRSLSVRTPSRRKTDLKQAPVRGLGTPNGGIVVFDKTSGEAMNIMPKSSPHVTLRCQDDCCTIFQRTAKRNAVSFNTIRRFMDHKGSRTLDLSDANRTLSQLSYKPIGTIQHC